MRRAVEPAAQPTPGEYIVTFTEAGQATVRGPSGTRRTDVRMLVDDHGISLAFGTTLPSHLADVLDIAVAAYVADRLCVRRPRSSTRVLADELWQRRMTIRLPLRRPELWSLERRAQVEGLLGFLTDDSWCLEFTEEHPKRRLSETQGSLFQDIPLGDVTSGLLSGGLDSLAGLTAELRDHPARTVIAFSARTNRRIGWHQREQVLALTSIFGERVRHIPVTIRLKERKRGDYDGEESSQRTRGFVFQIFGAVTAAIANANSLQVYENGVGALNLPYSASQLGAQATRATNPLTVGRASHILSDVIGHPFRVGLPHQFNTKAEMCAVFHDARLRDLVRLTISCDNFPQRIPSKPQCGICPSCLYSRQSLFTAGLRDSDSSARFRHDIYNLNDSKRTERSYHLRVMTTQAATLVAAMLVPTPWAALVHRYPILRDIAHYGNAQHASSWPDEMLSLLNRYSHEWMAFWNVVRPRAAVVA